MKKAFHIVFGGENEGEELKRERKEGATPTTSFLDTSGGGRNDKRCSYTEEKG